VSGRAPGLEGIGLAVDEDIAAGRAAAGPGEGAVLSVRVGDAQAEVIGAARVGAVDDVIAFGGSLVPLEALVALGRVAELDVLVDADRLAAGIDDQHAFGLVDQD